MKGSCRVPHEKKSKSPSFIWLFRHHNNNIYPFWKEDDDEDQGFVGDERAWGRRSLAPNRPGSSSFGLSREHARKREREREREKKRARRFELRKKKEEKRGVTKRRVEVRILASLAHHE